MPPAAELPAGPPLGFPRCQKCPYVRVGCSIGHVEAIIRSAANEDLLRRWPFDVETPTAVIKAQPTPRSAGVTAGAKRAAGDRLRSILQIPDPARTAGCKILVFDDVCTTGSQLNAVAGYLLDYGGAAQVRGLVLARAPWRPK